jgi:hypothetical protein
MKRNILFSLISIFFLAITVQSCGSKSGEVRINDEINVDTKKQVAELNNKLFKSIMASDTNAVRALLSPELIKKAGGKIDKLIKSTSVTFNAKEFEVKDEYYTKHPVKDAPDTLFSKKGNDNDYLVTYKAMNEEMYTSVLVSKGLFVNCLVLAVYGKYNNEWKVNVLQIGEYSINGKTAQDYYKEATKLNERGELVDASNMMVLTSQLANPAGDFFKYRNEDALRAFYDKLMASANEIYKFPVTIKDVKTAPQIFSVSPQLLTDEGQTGVFPLIRYVSKIDLVNTTALKAENDSIQKAIGALFLGIEKNNRYIFYQAVNATAGGQTSTKHYGFIQKTAGN